MERFRYERLAKVKDTLTRPIADWRHSVGYLSSTSTGESRILDEEFGVEDKGSDDSFKVIAPNQDPSDALEQRVMTVDQETSVLSGLTEKSPKGFTDVV